MYGKHAQNGEMAVQTWCHIVINCQSYVPHILILKMTIPKPNWVLNYIHDILTIISNPTHLLLCSKIKLGDPTSFSYAEENTAMATNGEHLN